MKPHWPPRALQDVTDYAAVIAKDNESAAYRWVDKVFAQGDLASRFPNSGRVVPEFGRDDLRQFIVASHHLIYRVKASGVEIVRVFHSAQLLHEGDVSETEA
jgi:toxin ParE1/3/4